MKFKIEGVNAGLFSFFLGKIHFCVIGHFWGKKKTFSPFTSCILNFIALPFQNSLNFGSSSYQKKVLGIQSRGVKKRH